MKIAIFHELHAGGARRAVNEIGKRLKKNHKVDLYIVDQSNNKAEHTFFNNTFFYSVVIKKWQGGNWKTRLFKDTIELYNLYRLHKKIAKEIDKKKYDIVFIHPSQFTQAPFLLRFIKTPKIYYCEEVLRMAYESHFIIDRKLPLFKRLYEKMTRWIRKKIDKKNILSGDIVLANSKHTRDNIASAYGIKSLVCYLGVDVRLFKPSRTEKNSDILFIGGKENIDGYEYLIKAITHMKYKPKLKAHISSIDWFANDKQLVELYSRARVVVCLAHKEPFGLVPLEAMACGVPVLAVNEGGYKETVIDGETGYLVSRNAKDIARKLDYMLTHQQKLLQMAQNARRHVVHDWTWDNSVKQLESIFTDMVSKNLLDI